MPSTGRTAPRTSKPAVAAGYRPPESSSPYSTPRAAKPEVKISKDSIKEIFSEWDLNKDGSIQCSELGLVFKFLQPLKWSDMAVKRLFNGMDLDENGDVSCNEFIEWVFDSGTKSFKGALEIGEQDVSGKVLDWSMADAESGPQGAPDILAELRLLEGIDVASEMQAVEYTDLQKIRHLAAVPDPIRRVLDAVYLLLLPSTGIKGLGGLTAPEWEGIAMMLKAYANLELMQNVSARLEELSNRPIWGAYAARTFFTVQEVDPDLAALEPEPAKPLRYDRLSSACDALFGLSDSKSRVLLTLYKWVLYLLQADLRELVADQK